MEISYENLRVNRILKKIYLKEIEQFIAKRDASELSAYKRTAEEKFSEYLGCKRTYFLESGTVALKVALYLASVRSGDEVILPAVGWPSAAIAVLSVGAKPVFVDIKEDCTIDENKVEEKITSKTKAILPVHLFGHVCEIHKLMDICKSNKLVLIEDACQSHGSTYEKKKTGTFGLLNAFSFDIRKSISSMGSGGALSFNDPLFYEKVEQILNFMKDDEKSTKLCIGRSKISFMDVIGILTKIKFAEVIEKNKIENKKFYEDKLSLPQVKKIKDEENKKSIRSGYVCYFEKRNKIKEFLKNNKIFPEEPYLPMPRMKIFSKFAEGEEFPNADYYYENALHLPLFSMMTKKEALTVAEKIREFYR